MESELFDFYCGLFKCVLGLVLIFFGIIGWPATRYILGLLAFPFTRRTPHKPVGSKFWDKVKEPDWTKNSSTPFWDKYKNPDWMRHE